jgi:xanthine dehydrogenase accessory factor
VVTSVKDPKSPADFPGAASVTAQAPELLDIQLDDDTAVVLMNHNYVQDLKYALQLEPHLPRYIGILGSRKRREKLEDDLFQHKPDLNTELLERIYSPAGLHIGSITPEEIALSILAEILAVYRGVEATSLSSLPQKKTSS